MRFHKIANVNKALDYIASKGVKLVSIGAEGMWQILTVHFGHITEQSGGHSWPPYVRVPRKSLNVVCWTVSMKGQEVEIFGVLERDRGINEH